MRAFIRGRMMACFLIAYFLKIFVWSSVVLGFACDSRQSTPRPLSCFTCEGETPPCRYDSRVAEVGSRIHEFSSLYADGVHRGDPFNGGDTPQQYG